MRIYDPNARSVTNRLRRYHSAQERLLRCVPDEKSALLHFNQAYQDLKEAIDQEAVLTLLEIIENNQAAAQIFMRDPKKYFLIPTQFN